MAAAARKPDRERIEYQVVCLASEKETMVGEILGGPASWVLTLGHLKVF